MTAARILRELTAAAAQRRVLYSGGDDGYLSDSETETTLVVAFVISMMSLIGSLFIIACYVAFPHLRKFAFTLVMILSVTDVLNQAMDFVQPSVSDLDSMEKGGDITPACYVQAIGNSIFELSSVLWTTAIAATLYMFIFLRMPPDAVERKLPFMFLVCFGIPIILAALPLSNGAYGPSGAWCWIRTQSGFEYWQFIQFYGPLWIAIAFNTFVYVRTWRLLRRSLGAAGADGMSDETYRRLKGVMQRLQMYPFILLVVWLFASINRIYEAASGGRQVFALYFLQRAFSSSQGFLNALAYGFSGGVREAIRDVFVKCCPGICKENTMQAARDESMGGLGAARSTEIGASKGPGGGNNGSAGAGGGGGAAGGSSSTSSSSTTPAGPRAVSISRARLQLDGPDEDVDDDDIRVAVPLPAAAVAVGAAVVRNPLGAALAASSAASAGAEGAAGAAGGTPGSAARTDRVRGMQSSAVADYQ